MTTTGPGTSSGGAEDARGPAAVRPTALGLMVLGLLRAAPMHPYAMQRLIKLWGKDQVVNVGQRANLYKTIKRLNEAGLVAVRQTERDQQYPERTVYELTDEGRLRAEEWLVDMLSSVRNEFPELPAALSFAMLLAPADLAVVLEKRAAGLTSKLAELQAELATYGPQLPRVTLLETEYLVAVTAAELAWLAQVTAELASGTLTWDEAMLAGMAAQFPS